MNKPHRLFDFFEQQLKDAPNETMLAAKEGGKWHSYTTTEVKLIVDQLAAGLLALGYGGNNMTVEAATRLRFFPKIGPSGCFWILPFSRPALSLFLSIPPFTLLIWNLY